MKDARRRWNMREILYYWDQKAYRADKRLGLVLHQAVTGRLRVSLSPQDSDKRTVWTKG